TFVLERTCELVHTPRVLLGRRFVAIVLVDSRLELLDAPCELVALRLRRRKGPPFLLALTLQVAEPRLVLLCSRLRSLDPLVLVGVLARQLVRPTLMLGGRLPRGEDGLPLLVDRVDELLR